MKNKEKLQKHPKKNMIWETKKIEEGWFFAMCTIGVRIIHDINCNHSKL